MRCPYKNAECEHVNTLMMDKSVECQSCEYYLKWKEQVDSIRETGALPNFEWLTEKIEYLFKHKKKKITIDINDISTFFPEAEEIAKHAEYMTDFWQRNGRDMSGARDYIMAGASLTIDLIERSINEYRRKHQ